MKPAPKSKAVIAGFGAAVIAASTIVVGMAGAQGTSPLSLCGDHAATFGTSNEFQGIETFQNRLIANDGPLSHTVAFDLSTGNYEVFAVAFDGYEGRDNSGHQPSEQWFAEFLSADGTVLDSTNATVDLQDNVASANWSGSVGQIDLDQPATQVRAVHVAPGENPNSVRAVCVSVLPVNAPTPTTAMPDPEPSDPNPDTTVPADPDPDPKPADPDPDDDDPDDNDDPVDPDPADPVDNDPADDPADDDPADPADNDPTPVMPSQPAEPEPGLPQFTG